MKESDLAGPELDGIGDLVNKLLVARDENKKLRAALTLVASFKGLTLFSYTRGDEGNRAYMEGSHAAFEQAADISQSALGVVDQQTGTEGK